MIKSLRQQTLHYFARPHEGPLREPLNVRAAWRGDALQNGGTWRAQLAPDEVDELKRAVAQAMASGRPLRRLRREDFPLPRLAPRSDRWRAEVRDGRGFQLISGVPVQDWSEEEAATFFWGLGQHLGLPGAQNPQGDLLGHVRDQRTGQDVRYYRTNKAIKVHCDAADLVGLLCLQPARSGGLSRIVSSVTVYNELLKSAPALAERLYQPLYFDTKGEGGIKAFPIRPCAYAGGVLRTFWQSDYYRTAPEVPGVPPLDDAARELLARYDAIAETPGIYLDMDLQPGDVQLLSNHTILHARTGFEDSEEPGKQRHLLRLWLSLPEDRPLKLRWLRARSWVGLHATAVRELVQAVTGRRASA